jgi:molybdenum cofactor guanylyltransferase
MNEWCGLVLAGGKSSRMGRDKAGLLHPDGRSLARRCHDLLGEAGCREVWLSLRMDQELPEGFDDLGEVRVVRDEGGGPMAGMVAAMRARPGAHWLVVACDLPRLDVETLRALVEGWKAGEPFLAYRSESDGLPEPLCAFYGSDSLAVLEQALAADMRCPRKVLIRSGCRLLDAVTPRALDNANTPEDWEAAVSP